LDTINEGKENMAKAADAQFDAQDYVRQQTGAGRADAALATHLRARLRTRFVPVEHDGSMEDAPHQAKLTVDLGGEQMRCLVRLVIDEDTVVVEITGVCMSKNHSFRQGDFVAAKRGRHMGGHDEWQATSRNAVDEAQYQALGEKRRLRLEAEQQPQTKTTRRRRAEK
jgi:hypothetical protein